MTIPRNPFLALLAATALLAPVRADDRADLHRVREVVQGLEDRIRLASHKLDAGSLDLLRACGQCEALLDELDARLPLQRLEVERLTQRQKALQALPELAPATRTAAEAARSQARDRLQQLTDARQRLRERLTTLQTAYVRRVVDQTVQSAPVAQADPVLDEVQLLLAPPTPSVGQTPRLPSPCPSRSSR